MVPLTRRRALQSVALAVGLAGCNGLSGSASHSDSVPPRSAENVAANPPTVSLRNPTGDPVFLVDESTAEGEREPRPEYGFVADAEAASALSFADPVDGVDEARAFLDETTYDSETVYYVQQSINECYWLEFCYVTWSETDVDVQFSRRLRDAQASCDADSEDGHATFVRLPEALDTDSINSYGMGVGRGCHPPPEERADSGPTDGEGSA
ncbi:hypothetical protein ACFQJD_07030 [Haloplanus sp. GCM10025708]|uniref:hypothetical protein n=1 Tax=Haloferacaceae TaxID=1644056 RepID=UPI00361264A8